MSTTKYELVNKVTESSSMGETEVWACEDIISPDFCRLCLKRSQILKSMFHCSVRSQTYAEIYEICTGYKISDCPQLPNRICNSCESSLISYYNFRITIDNIEERLELFQSQLNKKEENLNVTLLQVDRIEVDDEEPGEEQFEVEQLYDDGEDFFEETEAVQLEEISLQSFENDASINEKSTSCVFTLNDQKEVKCRTCFECCQLETDLNGQRPNEDFPITCECSKVFKNRRSFTKHYATIHVKKKKPSAFPCRGCSETFPNWRTRIAHEAKVHNIGYKFSCALCGKKFYRSDHFKDHEKSCNKIEEDKFFSCTICLFTFQREDTYQKHLETAHVGANENETRYAEKAVEYAKKYSKRKIPNELSTTTDDETFKKISEGRVTCKECNKTFKNNLSLNKHASLFHSDQIWGCELCNEVFLHRSTKISHMSKVHGVQKPFNCQQPGCEFSCFKRDRFNAHIQKHKDPDVKFPCPICQQEFKSYNTMTLHRAKHLSKNTYVCATCSKQFLDKRNYNIHLKLHTGENLYHCNVCSRGFNRKDHLNKHQMRKNHHKTSD